MTRGPDSISPVHPRLFMFSRRRALISLGALVCAPRRVLAQERKPVRLGYLSSSTTGANSPLIVALKDGLKNLGYVEGRNLTIDYKFASAREELPAMAEDLVKQRVDVILAGGSEGIVAAKNATKTIPIVMTNSGDAVREGFAASLARPGGNITGLTQISPELAGKRLEIANEMLPDLDRVAVLWHPLHPNTPLTFRETSAAAQKLGLKVVSVESKDPKDFEDGFAALAKARVGAIVVIRDPFMVRHRALIAESANRLRLPTVHETSDFVQSGGLMYYGPDFSELFRRSASYVDKLLKGAKAAELPVEQPTKFELGLNLRTAAAIGLKIPGPLRMRADKVIE